MLKVMDASISLVDERQQLAPIVKNFHDELKVSNKPGAFPWPTTAVFAFDHGVMPLGVNTGLTKPLEIPNTLINVPIDKSGTENVMTAVASAVASVPINNRNTRIEVVVWTNESGNDLNALQNVIPLCRLRNPRVQFIVDTHDLDALTYYRVCEIVCVFGRESMTALRDVFCNLRSFNRLRNQGSREHYRCAAVVVVR